MPARRRRGGDRAACERVGTAAPQVVARARCRAPNRRGRDAPALRRTPRAFRRGHRRLPRPLRRPGGTADRPWAAGRLQPARLAARDPRRGPRPFLGRLARSRRPAPGRPAGAAARRPGRRRHGPERAASRRTGRAPRRTAGCLLRRRRGTALPARLAAAAGVPCALRRQADPAPRRRDDPRRGTARARDPVPHRRQRPARRAAGPGARRTSSGSSGSSTSTCPRSSSGRGARSGSSAPRRRRAG